MCTVCVAMTVAFLVGSPGATLVADTPPRLTVLPVVRETTIVVGQPLRQLQTARPEAASVVETCRRGLETVWHENLIANHIYVVEGRLTRDIEDRPGQGPGAGEAYFECEAREALHACAPAAGDRMRMGSTWT